MQQLDREPEDDGGDGAVEPGLRVGGVLGDAALLGIRIGVQLGMRGVAALRDRRRNLLRVGPRRIELDDGPSAGEVDVNTLDAAHLSGGLAYVGDAVCA